MESRFKIFKSAVYYGVDLSPACGSVVYGTFTAQAKTAVHCIAYIRINARHFYYRKTVMMANYKQLVIVFCGNYPAMHASIFFLVQFIFLNKALHFTYYYSSYIHKIKL